MRRSGNSHCDPAHGAVGGGVRVIASRIGVSTTRHWATTARLAVILERAPGVDTAEIATTVLYAITVDTHDLRRGRRHAYDHDFLPDDVAEAARCLPYRT